MTTTMPAKKIRNFTDLVAWQEAQELAIFVYKLTKKFPRDELFGLTSQMRRAVVSVGSNIAEGFGRQGVKDKTQFYIIARGSLVELESQLLLAERLEYCSKEDVVIVMNQAHQTHRLLSGLITKMQSS